MSLMWLLIIQFRISTLTTEAKLKNFSQNRWKFPFSLMETKTILRAVWALMIAHSNYFRWLFPWLFVVSSHIYIHWLLLIWKFEWDPLQIKSSLCAKPSSLVLCFVNYSLFSLPRFLAPSLQLRVTFRVCLASPS